jgi:hypothetical protein
VTGGLSISLPDRLLIVVEAACLAGSPVAGQDDKNRREIVTVTMRRWRSFSRRSARHDHATYAERVEDLAKGLRDRFEDEPRLAGPLMEDYRRLAAELATVLTGVPAG